MARSGDYIPALRFHALTRVYDPLIRWAMREEVLKSALLDRAGISGSMRVLDVGCGTGTLTVMAKRANPEATVVGLDPDPAALGTARAKAAGLDIRFEQGKAQALPFPDAGFDRVLTSLMLHHLDRRTKVTALQEMHRVLTEQGELLVLDFTAPRSRHARLLRPVMRHLEHADDNLAGRLSALIRQAGFAEPTELDRFGTVFGDVAVLAASAR